MSKYYKCQVLSCKNLTTGHLCDSCIEKILSGRSIVVCSNCGSVLEIKEESNREIVWVQSCSLCKGTVRRVPWDHLPVSEK
jgi:hypothetical protein